MNVGDVVSKKVRGKIVKGKISEIDYNLYQPNHLNLTDPWLSITWDDPMEGRATSVLSIHKRCGINFDSQ